MNILVTGGAGFIGTNLIKRLLNEGHKVHSLDDYSTGSKKNHQRGCRYMVGKVEAKSSQANLVQNFDLIYHLAGLSRIQPSFNNPNATFEEIGEEFNISKQRAWEIVQGIKNNGKMTKPPN